MKSVLRKELLRMAALAQRSAYVPYSGYRVGAALSAGSGQIYLGANVENASYGLSICAERVAVVSAVVSGERRVKALAVRGSGRSPALPCGACRQVLAEFARPETPVFVHSGRGVRTFRLGQLLAHPFTVRGKKPKAKSQK